MTVVGIPNDYGIHSLLDIEIPRGSEYSHTVTLYNPSKDKKIRIHRVGSSDDSIIELIINAPTELGLDGFIVLIHRVVCERARDSWYLQFQVSSDWSEFLFGIVAWVVLIFRDTSML